MALPQGIESTSQLLEAQAHVWNHIFSFINSMALKCAVQLKIPDIINNHGKPIAISELTEALKINESKSHSVYRLMRLLTHSKFFTVVKADENDDEAYWLTPSSRLLLHDEPSSITPFVLAMLDPVLTDPWHHVSEWFQSDDRDRPTPFKATHGKTLWEVTKHDTRMNQLFQWSMSNDAVLASKLLVRDCKHVFEGLESIVDVGGGKGDFAKAMADEFPEMKCTVLELPHVVTGLEGGKNLTFVGGDMFQSIPATNAIFMKLILHGWPDDECVKILKNCKKSIPSKEEGGKVIIVDVVVDEGSHDEYAETQMFFDMLMMFVVAGRERTQKEWEKLFLDSGFSSYKITPVLGIRSLIEVFP